MSASRPIPAASSSRIRPRIPHAVAAACLTAGIDGGEINRVLFETKSRPRFEMERIVFDTMEFHEDGAIAVAVLWRKDIDRVRRGYGRSGLDRFAHAADRGRADRHYDDRKGGRNRSRFRAHDQGNGCLRDLQDGSAAAAMSVRQARASPAAWTRRRPRCCA